MKTGNIVGNRYLLENRLGIGGMSEVWFALDQKLGRPVALKILHESLNENGDLRDRFLREAGLTARLAHPNVVPIFDSGLSEEGRPYIAMEYVSGQTLTDYIKNDIPIEEIQVIFDQILLGVGAAHRAGIVHRDLKPDNIIIEDDGRVRILDFGVALDMETLGEKTEAGTIIGTARYLSPEQAHGEAADERSDLYSIGIMLYEALAGQTPWESGSAISSLVQQSLEPANPPSQVNNNISPDLDQVTLHAIAYRPDLRFSSAEEFREALWNKEQQSSGKQKWLLLLIPLLLLAAGWWYIDGIRTIPDLRGKTLLQAREELFQEDLRWFSRQSPSSEPRGTIILSSPAAGTSARKGDTVILFVSLGPPPSTVPPLEGLSQEEAEKLLQEVGLRMSVTERQSAKTPGTVIGSFPEAGSTLEEGGTVRIEVAVPKQIPNCLNLQSSACEDITESSGWQLKKRYERSSELAGVVLRQQKIASNVLLIYISEGPQEIIIPDLRGLTLDEARSVLSSSSLGAIVQYREVRDETKDNLVLQQSPAAGTPSAGEEILLVVGRFSQ